MIHFTLGPVEMYERTKAIGALQNKYFRVPEFSAFVKEIDQKLKQFLNVPTSYHTILLASSGTGAMEAALLNSFTPDDRALIVNGGKFATYFIDICKCQGIPFDTVDVSFGETLTIERLSSYEGKNYTALLVNIHETSTGQLYDKTMLRDFCKRNNMYFIVDAISSVCADELDVTKYDMDAVILSSQKGFALPPGLGMVIISNRLYDEKIANNKVRSLYFDFKSYVLNMERFQTPFTPALGILYQLSDMLDYLLQVGPDRIIERTHGLAEYYRAWAHSFGLNVLSYPLSNAVTPVFLQDVSAFKVHTVLKEEYDIMVNPSALFPDNLFLIGHLGNLTIKDYNVLTSVLETVFEDLRNEKQ